MKIYCIIHEYAGVGVYGPVEPHNSREWFSSLEEAKKVFVNCDVKADWKSIVALDLGTLKEVPVRLGDIEEER